MANNELRQYRGPYAFADPMVAVRVESNSGADVTIKIKSTYWPVTVDWDDASEPELCASEDAADLPHEYALDGTYTITVTCGSGHTDSDTVDVTVNVP